MSMLSVARPKRSLPWRRGVCLGLLMTIAHLMWPAPSWAADRVSLRYGLFELAFPVVDLEQYAQGKPASGNLETILRFLDRDQQGAVRQVLRTDMPVDLVAADRVLNSPVGEQWLAQVSQAVIRPDDAGVHALRAATILGIKPMARLKAQTLGLGTLSVISFLKAYPAPQLVLSIPKAQTLIAASSPEPPTDRLTSLPIWNTLVAYQATVSENKTYDRCLFGDSISSALGNSLGDGTFNFAIGGMSTVSLIEQLKELVGHQTSCTNVIIAIGTNDAWYTISNDQFKQNLQEVIALTRSLNAKRITLLPAFYSTVAASKNPQMAGPIPRVDEINQLMDQVASAENVPVDHDSTQVLFQDRALKSDLTIDGVHLNPAGLKLYRQKLLDIWKTATSQNT